MGDRLTRAQAGETLGVTRQRIEQLIAEGRLAEQYEAGAGHFIDSDDVERARATLDIDKKHAQATAAPAKKPGDDPQADMMHRQHNLAKAKTAIINAQSKEMDFAIKKREYVPRSAVQADSTSAGKFLLQRLTAACQQLAPQVCVIEDQEKALALLRRVLLDGVLVDFRRDIAGPGGTGPTEG